MPQNNEFVGREWVLERIGSWLAGRYPVLVLSGQPGSGKSTLVARLAGISTGKVDGPLPLRSIDAWHHCRYAVSSTIDPTRVIQELSGQLARRVPGYIDALTKGSDHRRTVIRVKQRIERVENSTIIGAQVSMASASARETFLRLLREPFERIDSKLFRTIVIDALDEGEDATRPDSLASLLGLELRQPIPGLRFLLTTRPGRALDHIARWPVIDLIDDEPESGKDVLRFVRKRFSQAGVDPSTTTTAAEQIAKKSGGNFLFAYYVTNDANSAKFSATSYPESLSTGLADIYGEFLERQVRGFHAWRMWIRPLLGALCVAYGDGLTRDHLIALADGSAEDVDDMILACGEFLTGPRPAGPFRLYHSSLNDYLRTASDHCVYPSARTMALAKMLIAAWSDRWPRCDDRYALGAVLRHLRDLAQGEIESERKFGTHWLNALLNDPHFLSQKLEIEGISEALFDVANSTTGINFDTSLIKAVLQELPEELRLIFYLTHFEGFSYNEIADIVGQQVREVVAELYRGRRLFHEYIRQQAAI